uniref:Uncharacterized protein n=1 Tax=Aegilops tauschii subsp. strangulata TaxID=200361 RepID=A0A453Q5R0_AEGTS
MSCILITNNIILNVGKKSKAEASIAATSPKTPTKQGTQLDTPTSPMTRQRAVIIAIACTPPSGSTRSKTAAPSPLRQV